ncbi:D-alanyl-D-alanine carboxypeptidase/D-alanyl-D-alanine-endopeptidase [Gillisia sp. JM1]|uniref:D-alanyl-D-alanine carboxypeptidase/D-alanyl-D-alanine-endopeptidase n=1 Tax=Gillisia sp. JM1 TaxID=1283286 RepID=UPI000407B1EC|nr:D-alanyl-D-alanine carboxypeptidase [Gillisia sp. JM1]
MRSKILHSFSILLITSLLFSCSSSRKLNKELSRQLTSEVFDQSFTGFALYDLDKKKFVIEHNSNKYFTPASNIKLLTFYASLKELGDSISGMRYYTTPDSLVFWGTGDPSFLNPNLQGSKVFNFLKNSSKDLYFASSAITNPPLGSGWAWDDYNDAYSAERSQFPIYGNLVSFKWKSNEPLPLSSPSYFSDFLIKDQELSNSIRRDVDANIFRYNLSKIEALETNIPFKTSSELTAKLLSDTLNKPVTLISKPWKIQNKNIQTIYSIAADSLYKEMLQESDNFIAEQLLLLISEKISDSLSTNIAIDHIQSIYFNNLQDQIKWVDGSGLSRYNLITPRTLVTILDKILKELPREGLFKLLPAGGKEGTLKNWYASDIPYIFAKSGSLRNNYSLSGYLKTKSGKLMIFSFMNNNYVASSSEIKKAMEKMFLEIRNSY